MVSRRSFYTKAGIKIKRVYCMYAPSMYVARLESHDLKDIYLPISLRLPALMFRKNHTGHKNERQTSHTHLEILR